jgi:hypothetical protein
MTYRIVKITSFYKAFLNDYYRRYPEINRKSYTEQYSHLMSQGHAWSDYFQKHFTKLGIEAFEIVHNAKPLQEAWALENNIKPGSDIVLAQLQKIQPDIIFFQDSISFNTAYYKMIKAELPALKLMFGHCCSPFSRDNLEGFKEMNFMLACSPGFAKIFEKNNIPSFEFLHAFEPAVLNELENNPYPETDIIFTGSFVKTTNTLFHDGRLKLVEKIIENKLPITIYGNVDYDTVFLSFSKQVAYLIAKFFKKFGFDNLNKKIKVLSKSAMLNELPRRGKFRKEFLQAIKPPLYGIEMLKATSKAKIALNVHGGIAGEYAANMRMFEVTGAGSLLFTDDKKNINTIFEPDNEIVTYKNMDECISKLKWLLDNPDVCKSIAKAGKARTLKDHTIEKRVSQLHEIILNELKK